MNFRFALTNAILLTALSSGCFAAPQSTQSTQGTQNTQSAAQQIALFNSGNYQRSAEIGYEILRRNSGNSLARYYYAQTLYKLNRVEDAKTQFAECYKSTNDLKLKANSYDALKALAAASLSGAKSTQAQANSQPSAAADASGGSISTNEPALTSRKLQVMIDGAANIEAKRKQLAIDIKVATDKAADQLIGIEPYFERAILVNNKIVGIDRYENREYTKARDKAQSELKATIDDLNADFKRRESEILADCKLRGALYDEVKPGLKSQLKVGTTSQMQLIPQHTNGFVRHYVNYDGSSPVSLKARQGELETTKAAVTAQTSLAKSITGSKAHTTVKPTTNSKSTGNVNP